MTLQHYDHKSFVLKAPEYRNTSLDILGIIHQRILLFFFEYKTPACIFSVPGSSTAYQGPNITKFFLIRNIIE